jgi:hypothetical protein
MAPQTRFEIVQGPSKWDVLLESAINRDKRHLLKIRQGNETNEIRIGIHGVIWLIPHQMSLTKDGRVLADSGEEDIFMLWGHTSAIDIVNTLRPNHRQCNFIAFYDVKRRVGEITFLPKPYQLIVPSLDEPPLKLDGFFSPDKASARFCRMPDQVIKEYKEAIIDSPDAGDFCKKTLLWLIEKSDKLTKPIAISFTNNTAAGIKIASDLHAGFSGNCKHLDKMVKILGVPMIFSHLSGYFQGNALFEKDIAGYTIWLAPKQYDMKVKVFYATPRVIAEINAIKLTA